MLVLGRYYPPRTSHYLFKFDVENNIMLRGSICGGFLLHQQPEDISCRGDSDPVKRTG